MQSIKYFSEIQRFKRWWLIVLFVTINAVFIFGLILQVFFNKPFGNNPMSNTGLFLTEVIFLIISLFILNIKLETYIKADGIYVRYFPFHIKPKHYAWSKLQFCFVRAYEPIREYGGWGLRLGLFGKGAAFNVAGIHGIQLVLVSGKLLLIGTQKPEEAEQVLKQLNQWKPVTNNSNS